MRTSILNTERLNLRSFWFKQWLRFRIWKIKLMADLLMAKSKKAPFL